jgi:hypothetical protein
MMNTKRNPRQLARGNPQLFCNGIKKKLKHDHFAHRALAGCAQFHFVKATGFYAKKKSTVRDALNK